MGIWMSLLNCNIRDCSVFKRNEDILSFTGTVMRRKLLTPPYIFLLSLSEIDFWLNEFSTKIIFFLPSSNNAKIHTFLGNTKWLPHLLPGLIPPFTFCVLVKPAHYRSYSVPVWFLPLLLFCSHWLSFQFSWFLLSFLFFSTHVVPWVSK